MQTRMFKWSLLILCLAAMISLGACKKKRTNSGNTPGSVLVLQPATELDRVVKKNLNLKLKLFDLEFLAHLKVTLQDKVLWEKWFSPNKHRELTVEKKIDLTDVKITDGRCKLRFHLTDQTGGKTMQEVGLFVDRLGPSLAWRQPQPGATLRVRTKVELKIHDTSKIVSVKVLYNNKAVRTFSERPYRFVLDPSDYPAGNTTFWVHAKDSLGNTSAKSFTFKIVGANVGRPCTFTDSCKSPAICVKKKGEVRGYCRRRCRRNRDCDDGMKCMWVGTVRVCEQPYNVTKKGVTVAALFDKCSKVRPCGTGLVCISPPGRDSTCRARCNNGRCRRGFACRKVPWGEGGDKVSVCIETRPIKKRRLQRIGQKCGPRRPCVKVAMCVRAGSQPAKCYKICRSNSDCSGVRCNSVPGKSKRVCVNIPRTRVRVGAYQRCGKNSPCKRGLQCMTSSGGRKPICFPKCGSSHCGSGSQCMSLGGTSICLSTCNPNSGGCPSGTKCRMLMRGKKGGYFCG